jgi:hypothetical protein
LTTTRSTFRRVFEATVATLDRAELRRAAQASAMVLTKVSAAAAQQCQAELPEAMARYVTDALKDGECS